MLNFVALLLRPDRSGIAQAFGPYLTARQAEDALEELAVWPTLRGQWEVRRLTPYKQGDAPNRPVPPSNPAPPNHPLPPLVPPAPNWLPPGSVYCTNVAYNSTPAQAAVSSYDCAASGLPSASAPVEPEEAQACVGEVRECDAPAPAGRPMDTDPRVFRLHPPADRAYPGHPLEVIAAYYVADGEFVAFRDNADETVLSVPRAEVGRIERLRTHSMLATSVEELETITKALSFYASVAPLKAAAGAREIARGLEAVCGEARERAAREVPAQREFAAA